MNMCTYLIREKSMVTDPWLRKQSAEDVLYDDSRQKELVKALKCQMLLNDELEVTII